MTIEIGFNHQNTRGQGLNTMANSKNYESSTQSEFSTGSVLRKLQSSSFVLVRESCQCDGYRFNGNFVGSHIDQRAQA